jgi:hypothetical protein
VLLQKTMLLKWCKDLRIHAQIRLRKADVFGRLMDGLVGRMKLSRGGEMENDDVVTEFCRRSNAHVAGVVSFVADKFKKT